MLCGSPQRGDNRMQQTVKSSASLRKRLLATQDAKNVPPRYCYATAWCCLVTTIPAHSAQMESRVKHKVSSDTVPKFSQRLLGTFGAPTTTFEACTITVTVSTTPYSGLKQPSKHLYAQFG